MVATDRRRRRQDDRGAVTVEAAVALAALIFVFALMLSGVSATADQMRCVDAASTAARLAARGDPSGAERSAREIAPSGAEIAIKLTAEHVHVTVRASPTTLPGLRLTAEAYAVREPDG